MRAEIELYLLSLRHNGIPEGIYSKLPEGQKRMLEQRGGGFHLKPELRKKFKVALTGGAFDIVHIGHLHTLERSRELADVLVVAVATDETIERIKGRKPVHNVLYRTAMVGALKPVDLALSGGKDREETLRRVSPDLVVFGPDQTPFVKEGAYKIVKLGKLLSDEKGLYKTSRIIEELEL